MSQTRDFDCLAIGDRDCSLLRLGPINSLSGPSDTAVPVLVILNVERKCLIDADPLVDEDHWSGREVQVVDTDKWIIRECPLVVVPCNSD
jgi:hypothetical protein